MSPSTRHEASFAESVRKGANWLLIPASVGMVVNVALALFLSERFEINKDIIAVVAVVIAGAIKYFAGGTGDSEAERTPD